MKIFIGLGNPGKEYETTYHNVGRLALEALLKTLEDGPVANWKKYKDVFEYIETNEVVFARPLVYMNESGRAVREMLKKFKAKPQDLFLLHDDSDILVGHYKISFERNAAGHKGVQSVIDTLKTNAFTRGRIGIRPIREAKRQKAGEFTLTPISVRDKKIFAEIFDQLYKNVTWKE